MASLIRSLIRTPQPNFTPEKVAEFLRDGTFTPEVRPEGSAGTAVPVGAHRAWATGPRVASARVRPLVISRAGNRLGLPLDEEPVTVAVNVPRTDPIYLFVVDEYGRLHVGESIPAGDWTVWPVKRAEPLPPWVRLSVHDVGHEVVVLSGERTGEVGRITQVTESGACRVGHVDHRPQYLGALVPGGNWARAGEVASTRFRHPVGSVVTLPPDGARRLVTGHRQGLLLLLDVHTGEISWLARDTAVSVDGVLRPANLGP